MKSEKLIECMCGVLFTEVPPNTPGEIVRNALGIGPGVEVAEGDRWALGLRRTGAGDGLDTGLWTNAEGSIHAAVVGEVFGADQELPEGGTAPLSPPAALIAQLHRLHGARLLGRVDGHFVAALLDSASHTVHLLVDWACGVHTIYYAPRSDRILFATRLQPLIASLPAAAVNEGALVDLLTFGHVLPPDTLFEGVHRAVPGSALRWQAGRVSEEVGWGLPRSSSTTEPQCVDRFLALYEAALERRVTTPRPWGAFLSGGLDSSMNVATAHKLGGGGFPTFSVSYPGYGMDEGPYSRLVAEAFGTDHHEVRLASRDHLQRLPEFVWAMEEPSMDNSFIPTYLLAEAASEHVQIVLSGDGPDHLLGRHWPVAFARRLLHCTPVGPFLSALAIPSPGRGKGLLAGLWRRLRQSQLGRHLWKALAAGRGSVEAAYLAVCADILWRSADPSDVWHLISDDLRRRVPRREFVSRRSADARPVFDQVVALDLLVDGSFGVFAKVGKAAEAHGLSLREPYLDRELAAYVASLPAEWKVNGSFAQRIMQRATKKHILRLAAQDRVPQPVLAKRKQGFEAPIAAWMGELTAGVEPERVLGSLAEHTDWLDWPFVRALFAEQRAGRRDHEDLLGLLVLLDLWTRTYIVGDGRRVGADWGDLF